MHSPDTMGQPRPVAHAPRTAGRSSAARGYGRTHGAGLVENASPHELVRLMLDGAVASLGAAIDLDASLPGERAARHRAVDRALGFVQELQGSLRDVRTDPLSGRLFDLYAFVVAQLVEGTREDGVDKLRLARTVLVPLAEAWRDIGGPANDMDSLPRAA